MTATIFFEPQARPLSNSGAILPAATLTFYLTETTTPADVYADADLQVSLGNVLTADADGRFDPFYLDATITYRVILEDENGVEIYDVDPYMPPRDFVPGTVVLFYGTAGQRDAAYPPAQWAVLDGNNGTPNGLERYIRIAGGGTSIGSTGGASSVTDTTEDESAHTHEGGETEGHAITIDEMPSHNHDTRGSYSAGGYSGGGNQFFRATTGAPYEQPAGGFMDVEGGGQPHTHDGTETGPGSAHAHPFTVETLSPYIALWAVMRKYP